MAEIKQHLSKYYSVPLSNEAVAKLFDKGFKPLDSRIAEGAPLRHLLIDTHEKTFLIACTANLEDGREIAAAKYNEQIHTTTLNDILEWEI